MSAIILSPAASAATIVLPQPVAGQARIRTLDIIRGFALMGVLLMNLPEFNGRGTEWSELVTLAPHSLDFKLAAGMRIGGDGTFRALFSMLFGAGMLLFTAKKETDGSIYTVADYYYRRLLWLLLFGLLDAFMLLWFGDVLYWYALCGLLLFPFRLLKPGRLALVAGICLALVTGKIIWQDAAKHQMRTDYLAATQLEQRKLPLSASQQQAKTAWTKLVAETTYNAQEQAEAAKEMQKGYQAVFRQVLPKTTWFESSFFYEDFWDPLLMMFIGMALFKWGFFSNRWKTSPYLLLTVLGYAVGLSLGYFRFWHTLAYYHNPGLALDATTVPAGVFYDIQRGCNALANASLLLLLYRSAALPWLMRALANFGQMAFTNYLMQTVICTLFFHGYGLGYYGKLAVHQLFYVLGAVLLFQLVFSSIWLRYFRFGPFEWLWRSLTYWRRQPMRLATLPVIACRAERMAPWS